MSKKVFAAIDLERLNTVTGGKLTVDQVRTGANVVDKLLPDEFSLGKGAVGFSWNLPENPVNSALDYFSYPQSSGNQQQGKK